MEVWGRADSPGGARLPGKGCAARRHPADSRGGAPDWKRYEQPTMAAPESEFPIFMNIFATPKRKTLQKKL